MEGPKPSTKAHPQQAAQALQYKGTPFLTLLARHCSLNAPVTSNASWQKADVELKVTMLCRWEQRPFGGMEWLKADRAAFENRAGSFILHCACSTISFIAAGTYAHFWSKPNWQHLLTDSLSAKVTVSPNCFAKTPTWSQQKKQPAGKASLLELDKSGAGRVSPA